MGYRMNLSKIACAWLLVGLLGAGAACGDDDDDDGAGAGGTVAGSSGGGGAGSGGTKAGAGGASGAGAGGSAGSNATRMCGTATCSGFMAGMNFLMPCCDAANGNSCGVITDDTGTCTGLKQEGTVDTRCPNADSVAGTVVPGCCKMGNKCGLQSGTLMGCIERSAYPVGFLLPINMMPPPKLEARACDAAGMDAGAE